MEQEAGMGLGRLLLVVFYAVVIVLPFWRISVKAGYSGWLSLLIVVPLVNLVYIYYLGFSNWPSLKKDTQ